MVPPALLIPAPLGSKLQVDPARVTTEDHCVPDVRGILERNDVEAVVAGLYECVVPNGTTSPYKGRPLPTIICARRVCPPSQGRGVFLGVVKPSPRSSGARRRPRLFGGVGLVLPFGGGLSAEGP